MKAPRVLLLRPSIRLLALLLAAHVGLAILLVPLWFGAWTWGALLLAGLIYSLSRQISLQLGEERITELALHEDGTLTWQRYSGLKEQLRVDPQSTLMPWLAVLLLHPVQSPGRPAARRRVLTVLPDALSAEDFRQLRLWLRWCACRESAGEG